jgi:hypothetical protein
MAGADWNSTITVDVVFGPSPPSRLSFTTPLIVVDQATNTLGGDRVVEVTSPSDVSAALLAGTISAATAAALTAGFAQQPTPASIKVARHDTAGSETIAALMAAIEAVDTDWYGSAIYSRVAADVLAWAALIEARKKIFVTQSGDADWLTSGVPAGLSALAAYERTAVIYHDTNTVPADFCWLVSRLVFDPDVRSAPWDGEVRSVAALATPITAAQRNFAEGNDANIGLPFSSADFFVSPGVNQAGRPLYEIVSADWLAARVAEDAAYLKLSHTARGEKIIVDASGQAKMLAILAGRLQEGEDKGHFAKGQTRATAYPITSADLTAQRLRFKGEAQIGVDARIFAFDVYLQTDPLQTVV